MNNAIVDKLETLVSKATNAGNAQLLNRYLDAAIDDNRCAVIRSGSQWAVTTNGFLLYEGDFTTIRSKTVAIIEDHLNTMQSLIPVPVKTEITDADVEAALQNAGRFYMYVLEDVDDGEIKIEYSPVQINTEWASNWIEVNEVENHEAGRAARAANPRAAMRALLSRRT
ncbi:MULTISPECIES: hypothetical protein [Hyphomicrobiales]|jgi:hypothetical protein|uniref:hypothetical protein n=1 Tax=Methylobacterium sp. CCH7-A2 TaxID=1768789 RepID=UPI0008364590|nr:MULTISPECIES: hypothetical protein [Hyphomicrobiales]